MGKDGEPDEPIFGPVYPNFDELLDTEDDDDDEFWSNYAVKNDYCREDSEGIDILTLWMDDILPLVGLQGRSNARGNGIKSLGFIWLDVDNPKCRLHGKDKDQEWYPRDDEMISISEAEALISDAEKERSEDVEYWLLDVDEWETEEDFEEKAEVYEKYIDETLNKERKEIIDELAAEVLEKKQGVMDTNDQDALLDLVEELLANEEKTKQSMDWLKQQTNLQNVRQANLEQMLSEQLVKNYDMDELIRSIRDGNHSDSEDLMDTLEEMILERGDDTEDILEEIDELLEERSKKDDKLFTSTEDADGKKYVSVDEMREEMGKVLIAAVVVLTFGMILGCCGFLCIQKMLGGRNTEKRTQEAQLPVSAVDFMSARKNDRDIHSSEPVTDKDGKLATPTQQRREDFSKLRMASSATDADLETKP